MTHLRKLMLEELERRNYAVSTTRAYLRAVDEFALYFNRPPDQLGPDHIRQYQAYLFRERKLDGGWGDSFERSTIVSTDEGLGMLIGDSKTKLKPRVRLALQRYELACELDAMLEIGNVRPRVQWTGDSARWSFVMTSPPRTDGFYTPIPNLFGVIALNLAVAIARADMVTCSSCGQAYTPKKAPTPNRRNYCPSCGPRAAWKLSQRDRRRKLREGTV